PSDQSGLRGAYRGGGGGLDLRVGRLLGSNSGGRVQLVSGVAAEKNLDSLLRNLQAERDKQAAEIEGKYQDSLSELNTRRERALRILKGEE
ncbi:MAG: hypothetical protein AABW87_02145, partial [Nanoarchaeota archaeon]